MTFFRRMFQRLRGGGDPAVRRTHLGAAALIEQAHRAQHAEQYDTALEFLSDAMEIAKQNHDSERQVDITLVRGDILIAQGDYETAKFMLEELYEECAGKRYIAPMAYALVSLGVVAQHQDDWETARNKFEEARALAKNNMLEGALGRATARLASVYVQDDNAAFAMHLLQDAIPRLERSGDKELLSQFVAQLGDLHIALGNEQEGLAKLREALEYARLMQNRPQMLRIQRKLGDYAEAGSRLEDARKHYEEALSLAGTPRPRTARVGALLCQLSDVLLRQGHFSQSAAYASDAAAIANELQDGALQTRAEITLGTAFLRQDGTSEEGRALLQSAVNAHRESANEAWIRAMRTLAQAEIQAGKRERGEALLREALAAADSFPIEKAHLQASLGAIVRERDPGAALQHLQEALALYVAAQRPDQVARLRTDIGALYAQKGEGRRALKEYEQALVALNDVFDAPTRGIVLGNVAAAYSEYGDMDSAQDFFQQAIEIAHETGDRVAETTRRGNYGRLLALINEPRKAITELMQAQNLSDELSLQQLSAVYGGNLALAYAVLGNLEDAIERYQTALQSLEALDAPQWEALVRANLADAYAQAGRSQDAAAAYQQALEGARKQRAIAAVGQCLVGLAHLALDDGDTERARTLLDEAEPPLRRAFLRRSLAHLLAARSRLQQLQSAAVQAQASWDESKRLQRLMQMKPLQAPWLQQADVEQQE